MARWTKKAAVLRVMDNQELQQVCERYPLANLLIKSAVKFRHYPSYNRIACYYAYKDWIHAVILDENKDYWTCVSVIDDLLPPDDTDIPKEDGSSIPGFNPPLPLLPLRPDRPVEYDANGKRKYFYQIGELGSLVMLERQRHLAMRNTLMDIAGFVEEGA